MGGSCARILLSKEEEVESEAEEAVEENEDEGEETGLVKDGS